MIEEGESGFFFEPGDIDALATQIGALVRDEAMYLKISAGAIQSVYSRFTTQHYISQLKSAMEQLMPLARA